MTRSSYTPKLHYVLLIMFVVAVLVGAQTSGVNITSIPGMVLDGLNGFAMSGSITANTVTSSARSIVMAMDPKYGCKDDKKTDIGPCLQAAVNAAINGGTVELDCKLPGCIYNNGSDGPINWGNKSITIALEGVIFFQTTDVMPHDLSQTLRCLGASTAQAQWGSEDPWCAIEGPETTATLNTAVSTTDGVLTTAIVTPSSMAGIYPGSMLTITNQVTCSIASVTAANSSVSAKLSSQCDIPAGVPMAVTGSTLACANGSHVNGVGDGNFTTQDEDQPGLGLKYESVGCTGTGTGGTITGLQEDLVENVPVTSTTATTFTAPFYRSHPSGSIIGIDGLWADGDNEPDVIIGANIQSSGTSFVINSTRAMLDHIGTIQTKACSGDSSAMGMAVTENGNFDYIDKGTAIDASCDPYAIHVYNHYNAGYTSAGLLYLNGVNTIRGVKVDHGGGSVYWTQGMCTRCARGAIIYDPLDNWNGNAKTFDERAVEFNDDPDGYVIHDYYQMSLGDCPHLDIASNSGSHENSNQYACREKTDQPLGYEHGPVGTWNNGQQIEGDFRGEQAGFSPAIIPYATVNVLDGTAAAWYRNFCGPWTANATGPDGAPSAYEFGPEKSCVASPGKWMGTPETGDVILYGGWIDTPTPGYSTGTVGYTTSVFIDNNGSTHFSWNDNTPGQQEAYVDDPQIKGDWWHPVSGLSIVTWSDGTPGQNVFLNVTADNYHVMQYADMWMIYVPASAGIPLTEIERWQRQLMHSYVPPNIADWADKLFVNPLYKLTWGSDTDLYRIGPGQIGTDGSIQAHGIRNVDPSCTQATPYLKYDGTCDAGP